MMQEQVIVTPIVITKAGQVKHFQIKLPSNAKHIIGVEIGGKYLSETKQKVSVKSIREFPFETIVWRFRRNTLIGELKLQSCEEANIFYAGQLRLDNTTGYGDFTQNRFWQANSFTHQSQWFEDAVIVDADSTIIQGYYKDNLGITCKKNSNYQVNVYVWYRTKDNGRKTKDKRD